MTDPFLYDFCNFISSLPSPLVLFCSLCMSILYSFLFSLTLRFPLHMLLFFYRFCATISLFSFSCIPFQVLLFAHPVITHICTGLSLSMKRTGYHLYVDVSVVLSLIKMSNFSPVVFCFTALGSNYWKCSLDL
jgi:hypothetical protein